MVYDTLKVAEVQLSFTPNYKIADRPRIGSSDEAYRVIMQQWNLDTLEFLEEFKIILTNRRNRVLGVVNISSGGISSTVVDPKIIFATALKAGASGIVLVHNHPSGELDPSDEDITLTEKLKNGAKLLEIEILDHLIIGKESYYSFREESLI